VVVCIVLHNPPMVSFICGQERTENLANNSGAIKALSSKHSHQSTASREANEGVLSNECRSTEVCQRRASLLVDIVYSEINPDFCAVRGRKSTLALKVCVTFTSSIMTVYHTDSKLLLIFEDVLYRIYTLIMYHL